MSVINQMLKDLDQRAPEQGQGPVPVMAAQKASILKIVLISVVILLSLNALGLYIWDLQERAARGNTPQENKQSPQLQRVEAQAESLPITESNAKFEEQIPKFEEQASKQAQTETSQLPIEPIDQLETLPPKKAIIKNESVAQRKILPGKEKETTPLKEAKTTIATLAPEVVTAPKVLKCQYLDVN